MPLEKKLYKTIEEFAQTEFGCTTVKQQVGPQLGKIDVVGIHELHGDLETHNEIIAFEVKEERASYLSAIGQARAYSIFAHRCYLVYRERYNHAFTLEEIDIASQLGVGLIEIKSEGCNVAATSSLFSPRDSYVLAILSMLDLFRCTMCHAVYPLKNMMKVNPKDAINLKGDKPYSGQLAKAIKNQKNVEYYLFQLSGQQEYDERGYIYDRRYICKDCASIFESLI